MIQHARYVDHAQVIYDVVWTHIPDPLLYLDHYSSGQLVVSHGTLAS